MKCPLETRENEILLAYSSGLLDAGEQSLLDAHVDSCSGCRDFVKAQRTVWDALDVWEAAPVSADFDRRLYQRIDRHVSWFERLMEPFHALGLRRLAPLAASAAVVLMAGMLLERPSVAPGPPRDSAQMETLQPEQLENALDEMQALSQLSRPVRGDSTDSKM